MLYIHQHDLRESIVCYWMGDKTW